MALAWLCRVTISLARNCASHHIQTDRLSCQRRVWAAWKWRGLHRLNTVAEIGLSQQRGDWLCWVNKCFDYSNLTNPSCWLVLEQWELTWGCVKIPHNRNLERAVAGELQASDSCSRSLALMSVWCLESLAHVKPRLRPGSDWWSPRPQYCGAVFAPLNEAGGPRHCLALRLPFLSP